MLKVIGAINQFTPGSNLILERCPCGMLRLLVVFLLILLDLPAEAQQGRNDYPTIIPHDWTLLPPKSNEWRAVSPGKDAWLSLYATPVEGPVSSHLRRWGLGAGDRVTYQRQRAGGAGSCQEMRLRNQADLSHLRRIRCAADHRDGERR
jgi:hypothetical protein